MKRRSNTVIYVILGTIILIGLFLGFGTPANLNNDDLTQQFIPASSSNTTKAGNQLQLNEANFVTITPPPTPIPTNTCTYDVDDQTCLQYQSYTRSQIDALPFNPLPFSAMYGPNVTDVYDYIQTICIPDLCNAVCDRSGGQCADQAANRDLVQKMGINWAD